MQTWCLELDKRHHIAGTQIREGNRPLFETPLQKALDKRHVVDNGRFGQGLGLAQVLRVGLCIVLDRR